MYKSWRRVVVFASSEWLLTWLNLPNGGAVILARALITSSYLFMFALLLINVIDHERSYEFSRIELQIQVVEKIAWYGVIFAAVYTALYARFASQWSYLAGLYNNIKQVECNMHNAEVMAEWKSGFIEDSENLHLSCKSSFASIVKAWGEEELVKSKFISFTPGGEKRYKELMARVDKSICIINSKYK